MAHITETDDSSADMPAPGAWHKRLAVIALVVPVLAAGFYLLMDGRELSGVDIQPDVQQAEMPANHPAPLTSKSLPTVEEMLGRLEQRLQDDPSDAKGWSLLGKSYEHLGRHDEAAKAFGRAAEMGYVDAQAGPVPASIKGVIRLDPDVLDDVSGSDTVYVFARAVNGPRQPVAILRKTASELPFEFELDDSMAMTPAVRLSRYPHVIVGARVSTSGDATAGEGDLEGFSDVVSVDDNREVTIVIGQAVIK